MKRIIDKETKLFIRDDFNFNPETEIGLEVEPAQGFYWPKWNGTEWVEGGEPLPIPDPIPYKPTSDERLDSLEEVMLFLI